MSEIEWSSVFDVMGYMVTNLKLWVRHTSFILDGKVRLHEGVLV